MGGVPCAKILINRRLDAELQALLSESQMSTDLLMLKGDYSTPALQALIDFETQLVEQLKIHKRKFKECNDTYAKEEGYHSESNG